METSELLKKVRKIEITTRGLTKQVFAGEYHSAFKGRGMAFSEVREYQFGDDVRNIDWNVTARFGKPYIKIFDEERELTVTLLIDLSGSGEFGTQVQLKRELITHVAAVLAFSAIQNNDKVGVIFFTDKIEKFIPPKKGKSHILRIIRELIEFQPEHKETNIAEALRFFANAIKKRSTAFLISDFIDKNELSQALRIAKYKHDLIALRVFDKRETEIPAIGFVRMKDAESGKYLWVDTSNKKVRETYKKSQLTANKYLTELFKKSGIDYASISTSEDFVKPLMEMFKKRGIRS